MKIFEISIIIFLVLLCIIIICVPLCKKSKSKESYTANSTPVSLLTVNDNFQLSTIEFPDGVIMSYYPPDPTNITAPQGWSLCDGSNGTPDLRGRFILGHKSGENNFNENLGTDTKFINVENLPPHEHTVQSNRAQCDWIHGGIKVSNKLDLTVPNCPDSGFYGQSFKNEIDLIQTDQSPYQHKTAQTNSPPYYVMVYVMKKQA